MPDQQPVTPPGITPASPAMGQPPSGSSPATGPTPNLGYQAVGMAKLALVVKQLESLLPAFGAGSEPGQDVLESIKRLSKHIPPGSVSPATEQSTMQQMMLKSQQMSPLLAAQAMNKPQGAPPAPQPGA